MDAIDEKPDLIQRGDRDDMTESRESEVRRLCKAVKDDLEYWEYAFKRMTKWRQFARGYQWPGTGKDDMADPDRQYVTNVTMRHIQQRTASIYAKNPRFRFKKAKRLLSKFWDGTGQQLELAMQGMQSGDPAATMIVQDAMESRAKSQMHERVGETLSILYEYQVREQNQPTKKMMKKQVRAALTTGVAYIKQTFQRATELSPTGHAAIASHMSRIAEIERLAADLEDGEFDEEAAEMEQLLQQVKAIEEEQQIILREGLALDYPDSTNIIPDQNLTYLPGFVGCERVTEQYSLTPDQIKKIYGVDVSKSHTQYQEQKDDKSPRPARKVARVWEIWDQSTGLVCTICDGFNDYLVEPHNPTTYTDRFFPWFVLAPNAMDDADDPFPPSDVELMMCQQMEINRSGEGLREHRYAARPGHVAARNIPDSDAKSIEGRTAHQVITLQSLSPGERIGDLFQPFPTSPIDPNLYNDGPAFQGILRSVGTQEANLGGTSGATATESTISESSRQSVLASTMDEFDDMLTEMARAGGQILFAEMSVQQVTEIVGPGATWPEQSREQIAKEVELEVVAGSSGLPNQAMQVQIAERLFPILMQFPNVDPEWALRYVLRIMDDGIEYEDAIQMGALSIVAMNGQLQGAANRGAAGGPPQAEQAAAGGNNAPQPQMPQQTGPTAPAPVTAPVM